MTETERTAYLLFDAYMHARQGSNVYVIVDTEQRAAALRDKFFALFVKVPSRDIWQGGVRASNGRGRGFVTFYPACTNPTGCAGVVLAHPSAENLPETYYWAAVPNKGA